MIAAGRRDWANLLLHVGLVSRLAGVAVNQAIPRGGYLFLEQAGGTANFYLDRDLKRIGELPFSAGLDSFSGRVARGFRPSMVAWVSATTGRRRSTARSPTTSRSRSRGRQLTFARMVEPGFLLEYELSVGKEQYLLMHNQVARPEGGPNIWSFAYDAEERRVGLHGRRRRAVAIDRAVGRCRRHRSLKLESASFAARTGRDPDCQRRPVPLHHLRRVRPRPARTAAAAARIGNTVTGPLPLYLALAAYVVAAVAAGINRGRRAMAGISVVSAVASALGLALQVCFVVFRTVSDGFLPFASRFESMALFALAVQAVGLATYLATRRHSAKLGYRRRPQSCCWSAP